MARQTDTLLEFRAADYRFTRNAVNTEMLATAIVILAAPAVMRVIPTMQSLYGYRTGAPSERGSRPREPHAAVPTAPHAGGVCQHSTCTRAISS